MNSIFDNERVITLRKGRIDAILLLLMVMVVVLGLFFIKKEHIYENILYFGELDRAYLFTNKESLAIIKERKKILIDKIEYDFIIEKIEKKNNEYLVYISFPIEIKIQEEKYQLVMEKESLLKFIIRIIKGE